MRPISLKLKVSIYLIIVLSVTIFVFAIFAAKYQQEDLLREISRHAIQTSDVIVKSTRYAMLMNKRDSAGMIIQDIGRQKGIERVRVMNKDGMIVHSNHPEEIGTTVDQRSAPCIHCHQTSKPLSHVSDDMRWRIYETAGGRRLLGTMQPIRNEPSCSSASCHEHPANQSVLGIVDIAYSLDEVDQALRSHTIYIIAISLLFILLVSASVGVLLHRLIYLPLKDLEAGAKRISFGDLDHDIPLRNDDEFGRVAGSFNKMTLALKKSMFEMQELVQTLELKVEQRTRELRLAEAEAARGEKLASVGQLAAGIAHELNNPLTGVLTFTSLLRKKMPDGSQDAEDLDLVIRETKRCASIIRRLLDFAREKVPVKEFFDLKQLIEETVRMIEHPALVQKIEITTHLDADLPQIWGDSDLIKQVILNVLVNAEQAIEGQGSIIVESRHYVSKDPPKPGVPALPMVEIVIKDTGCGISEANLKRIFDPFFTSKEVGKGTGLGLSVSYGIIKAHEGRIKVESTVGAGTTFRIYLPILPPSGGAERNAGEDAQ
ncbi:putative Histidine kinase [Georgfuchsia toluolica]|uniref:histidine kinase n=1 Tax=Georgfuchsia toluolica TaxID=424218 RepID=A0A916N9Q9_9PROT|nr:ATP-binding protein [Georgfuchsia toluolica]CAG4884924.1 putative Histidine kinase [Georgfuchsia toluolica]